MRGENIEQDIAVTSLNAKTLGTYYFPQTLDDDDNQNETVSFVLKKPNYFKYLKQDYLSSIIFRQF